MKKLIFRIHKSIFPNTDHGFTWTECGWYEMDGQRITATFPVAACCERTGELPGGPIIADLAWEERHARKTAGGYAEPIETVRSERTHPEKHYVYSTCITQTPF